MADVKKGPSPVVSTASFEAELNALLLRAGHTVPGAVVAAALKAVERRRSLARIGPEATTSSRTEQDEFLKPSASVDVAPDQGAAMLRLDLSRREEVMLTTAQVAKDLGKAKSTITRQVNRGDLYAIKGDGQLRLPAWQFVSGAAVPGLAQALAYVPETWGPRRLRLFMTTPEEALGDRSPVQWLLDNEPPQVVAQLMADESRE